MSDRITLVSVTLKLTPFIVLIGQVHISVNDMLAAMIHSWAVTFNGSFSNMFVMLVQLNFINVSFLSQYLRPIYN